jgi:aspartate/methionine/tyrosine aminotransferase
VTFSARVPADLAANRLSTALAQLEREQRPVIDLTASNPTRADFSYPPDLLAPLGDARGLVYAPWPLGLPEARRAVAADFRRRGLVVAADHLALTASTSEAYSLLFKVLCDPGDEVLVPRPSYPLFEHLTRLDAVTAVPYDLEHHAQWSIDMSSVERAFGAKTRAVLLVNPNNPTGQFVSRSELDSIVTLCRQHDAAIISDEVFADYELTPGASANAGLLTRRADVLGFTLGGLSKSIGLPQAKLGWIAISGDDDRVREARARLELACDTYLSVSTPLQAALPELLDRGSMIRDQIQQRVSSNYRALTVQAAAVPACEVLHAEGGWYAVVHVPSLMSEDDLVLTLLVEDGVLTHPGYFFDFRCESFLILSLLPPVPAFVEGISRVLRRFDRRDNRS